MLCLHGVWTQLQSLSRCQPWREQQTQALQCLSTVRTVGRAADLGTSEPVYGADCGESCRLRHFRACLWCGLWGEQQTQALPQQSFMDGLYSSPEGMKQRRKMENQGTRDGKKGPLECSFQPNQHLLKASFPS